MVNNIKIMSNGVNNLYFHIPFCDGKCSYCAFYSAVFTNRYAGRYLDSLATEIDIYLQNNQFLSPQTIYIGGGTPSVLNSNQMSYLFEIIKSRIDISHVVEWTVEMNPGNFDSVLLEVMLDAGVNRISLGVQVFDDKVLKSIGRRHSVSDVLVAVKLLQKVGFNNYNIDLISSLPGVSRELWCESLYRAVELSPAHISLYNFSIEPGTVMEQQYGAGLLSFISDKEQLELLRQATNYLKTVGYGRYEISNYSLAGFEAQHNLACWHGDDYIGFGPSASSRIGVCRRTNNSDIDSYIEALDKKKSPPCEKERLANDIDITERLIFGFRLTAGIDLAEFAQKYSPSLEQLSRWEIILNRLVGDGLLIKENDHYCPTTYGLDLADYIAGEFL